MMNQNKALTSVVSYPERGHGGNNRYRGNCSPKLIEDLITHFRPHEVCDYMCGSNTTADAARAMGIVSHTAETRAKKQVIIVGDWEAVVRAIQTADTKRRNTMLAVRINDLTKE